MKPETIPMTMAIRALKAAKIDFELFTYDYSPHGGTAECSRELGIDHHAAFGDSPQAGMADITPCATAMGNAIMCQK